MPALPEATTHRLYHAGGLQFDMSNTETWEDRITHTSVVELDSGYALTVGLNASLDTFRMENASDCTALDTLRARWIRILEQGPGTNRISSAIFCDPHGNRISVVENFTTDDEFHFGLVRSDRIVNGLCVELLFSYWIRRDLASRPPEIRARVLRWMSDIRPLER